MSDIHKPIIAVVDDDLELGSLIGGISNQTDWFASFSSQARDFLNQTTRQ